ncbi:MAG: 5-bromo-4-chloroindolyl phosphate hydrolysis family protein [Eubacteriales bacterium]
MSHKNDVPAKDKIIEKDGRKYREEPVKPALPFWAASAVWLIAALALPMYRPFHLVLIALVSAAAAILTARLLPKETRLVELPFYVGNDDLDAMARAIADARDDLRAAREKIAGRKPQTAAVMAEIEETCAKIQSSILESPDDLPRIRRFLNYYLPTTRKLAAKYAAVTAQDADGANISETITAIEGALAQINTSFHHQLDALYADDALDVSTDITVLETMLARDNLK